MKINNKKKIVAVSLSAFLICSSFTPAFANTSKESTKLTKEESVYVICDANGNKTKTIVSDTIKNPKKGDLKDKSSLSNVENLKGEEKYSKSFNSLTWKSTGKDITYQGTTNKQVPINMDITYYLNGEEMSASEIVHKSGNIKIRYDFSNNTMNNVPFIVVGGGMLDTDVFSNIKVTNGKVVDNGDNVLFIGYSMPGFDSSLNLKGVDIPSYFELSAKVKDFTMDGIMAYATNEEFSDINLSDVNSIMDLTSSLDKLSSSSDELVKGSKQLNEGINTLVSKSGQLKPGVEKLDNGAKDINTGATKLKSGSSDLKSGINTLKNGDGSSYSYTWNGNSYSGTSTGIKGYTYGVKTASDASTLARKGLDSAAKSLDNTIKANQNALAELKKIANPSAEVQTAIGTLTTTIQGQQQIYQTMSIKTQGANTLAEAVNGVDKGLAQLSSQNKNVTDGVDALYQGSSDLNAGLDSLIAGTTSLKDGLDTLSSSSTQLIDGINKLQDGSKKLSTGMKQFDTEGIKKLVSVAGDLDSLKSRLNNSITQAKNYNNFSGISDNMDGSVKFVYKTQDIK